MHTVRLGKGATVDAPAFSDNPFRDIEVMGSLQNDLPRIPPVLFHLLNPRVVFVLICLEVTSRRQFETGEYPLTLPDVGGQRRVTDDGRQDLANSPVVIDGRLPCGQTRGRSTGRR